MSSPSSLPTMIDLSPGLSQLGLETVAEGQVLRPSSGFTKTIWKSSQFA